MTTSSSDRDRCNRISPSAVLDDRLDGKELEWARDHLRRCESCRERVEDFREMLLRVGRLPKAPIAATAMDQAFAAAIPERLREDAVRRSFEIAPADDSRLVPPMPEPPTSMLPEVTSIPDLMSELEREIFRDEPAVDHPAPLTSAADATYEAAEEPAVDEEEIEPVHATENLVVPPPLEEGTVGTEPESWREIPIDSHREPISPAWQIAPQRMPEPDPEPEPELEPKTPPEPVWRPEVEVPVAAAAPIGLPPVIEPIGPTPETIEHRNVIYDQEPAVALDEKDGTPPASRQKSDTAMRLAVGLGAAACVLLAAVLYEGGRFLPSNHKLSASAPPVATATHASATARPSASTTATPTVTAPPATVLFSFPNGASGGTVFRIRPGTAVAGLTRLVFDIHGNGLPTMQVTQPDDVHITVVFKDTTVSGVPVNGIRSYHVNAVEPGVQQGPDGSITIDLARPVRVTAFTLPATGSYAWRLVVDLHTS
jgi:hypothetical protein